MKNQIKVGDLTYESLEAFEASWNYGYIIDMIHNFSMDTLKDCYEDRLGSKEDYITYLMKKEYSDRKNNSI